MNDNGKEKAGISLPTVFDFGEKKITFKRQDGCIMVNASQMGKAVGKKPANWLRQKQAKEYINTVSESQGVNSHLEKSELVISVHGGKDRGTWMHEDVALEFARWVSPVFALWTNRHIKELMQTGSTSTGANATKAIGEDTVVNGAQVHVIAIGKQVCLVCYIRGRMWADIGYLSRVLQYSYKLPLWHALKTASEAHVIEVEHADKVVVMLDTEGFGRFLAKRTGYVNADEVSVVYKRIFRQSELPKIPDDAAVYRFTEAEMNEIFTAVGVPPFNRGQVMKLLSQGRS